jgi:hypothetical protein
VGCMGWFNSDCSSASHAAATGIALQQALALSMCHKPLCHCVCYASTFQHWHLLTCLVERVLSCRPWHTLARTSALHSRVPRTWPSLSTHTSQAAPTAYSGGNASSAAEQLAHRQEQLQLQHQVQQQLQHQLWDCHLSCKLQTC